jgi:hypothetical protein
MAYPTLIGLYDPTGVYYTLSVSAGGEGLDINTATAPTPPPAPPVVSTTAVTIKLKDTLEWAKRFIANRDSTIGNGVEPALTNASLVLQTILGPPFRWRWNRVITGFYTTAGQQDYYLFNWLPTTAVQVGWVTVDVYGNSQRVIVAGTTGASTPTWNNTPGSTTSDGTGGTAATWINQGNLGGSTSIGYDFGWIEGAVVKDTAGNYQECLPKIWLAQSTPQDRPRSISAQIDLGDGNQTFRLHPVPDQTYPVLITIQEKPGLFTKTSQTWAPIPDEYSRIYNWGFLALMWLFADDPRYQLANQKFVTQILGANSGLTDTERNIFLNNWQQVTGQVQSMITAQTQGFQSRST